MVYNDKALFFQFKFGSELFYGMTFFIFGRSFPFPRSIDSSLYGGLSYYWLLSNRFAVLIVFFTNSWDSLLSIETYFPSTKGMWLLLGLWGTNYILLSTERFILANWLESRLLSSFSWFYLLYRCEPDPIFAFIIYSRFWTSNSSDGRARSKSFSSIFYWFMHLWFLNSAEGSLFLPNYGEFRLFKLLVSSTWKILLIVSLYFW